MCAEVADRTSGERAQRRLAAILAADVAGFSRMVAADEAGTLAALREVWAAQFNPVMAAHGGRIVKMMGDGALVEFGSAVDAVEGAVRFQGAMEAFNAAHPGRPPLVFRIGVNLGDIVIEGDDILGDGVNVAARLEPLAPRGGVLVSDSIHAQVRHKVAVSFDDAGELALKNIALPVRAWSWGGEGGTAASARTDEVPSIAVLPFNNLSGDPEQEYFSDGIAEDIITDLSKIAGLMVVARNSSFAYKGRSPDIRVVGRELGVTSVLEGSIRRAGNRVRITAQLIDARTGHHLWADRYDRDLTDIFAVQDEVTMEIVNALSVRLRPAERDRIAAPATSHHEAHDLMMRARAITIGLLQSPQDGRAEMERAIVLLKAALAIDPGFTIALAHLSMLWTIEYTNRWTGIEAPERRALDYAQRAVAAGPDEAMAHVAMGLAQLYLPDLEAGLASARRAVELDPNHATAFATLGHIQCYLDDPRAALPALERATRLDPAFAQQYLHFIGFAHLMAGDLPAAVAVLRERVRLAPRTDLSRAFLASALGQMGEGAAAREVWDDLMAVNPTYSLDRHLARLPFRQPQDAARIRDGIVAAGIVA